MGAGCEGGPTIAGMGERTDEPWHSVRSRAEACELLGIPPSSDLPFARRAYLELARATHPDHGGDALTFQLVQEAWDLLRSEAARPPAGPGPPPVETPVPTTGPTVERGARAGCLWGLGGAAGVTGLMVVAMAVAVFVGTCLDSPRSVDPGEVVRCLVDRGWEATGEGPDLRFEITPDEVTAFEADLAACER
jgi:hypothetical protein